MYQDHPSRFQGLAHQQYDIPFFLLHIDKCTEQVLISRVGIEQLEKSCWTGKVDCN